MSIGEPKPAVRLPDFAGRLRTAMARRGLDQSGLAKAIGAKQSTVQLWVVGSGWPSGQWMSALPAALGVSADWLLTGRLPIEPPEEPADLREVYRAGFHAAADAMERLARQMAQDIISPASAEEVLERTTRLFRDIGALPETPPPRVEGAGE